MRRVTVTLALIVLAGFASLPSSCAVTGRTAEGFPVATCEDGTMWYQDMDGGAGVAPGEWRIIGG